MTGHEYTPQSDSCCGSEPGVASPCACPPCELKTYLTKEEEEILHEIRRVRYEADLLRGTPDGGLDQDPGARTTELRLQLTALREKLEDATERKLIALGHREPRP
jgi:hypothetical protein